MSIENNHHTPTQEQDKRITTVGSFLRKTRLDEVPQVLNIIKGEMSFVGPRPERPELIIKLEQNIPFYRERMLVKPGLTGWDQISGEYHSPSIKDTIKKLQYDLYYIKNRSFYLDLSIILKTLSTIISRAGR
jgi:lipopolysaccharide/colanic/teichoic acid biosynthesis glycosyltransferase